MMEKKTKILLAEDDPNFGTVMRDYLELHNFDVTLCNNGLACLNISQKKDFDLCILDVMMPELDGFPLQERSEKRRLMFHLFFSQQKP